MCQGTVPRPHDGLRILEMSATALSTQRVEDNVVITNLIIIEFGGRRAGWRHDLCNCQTSLRGGKTSGYLDEIVIAVFAAYPGLEWARFLVFFLVYIQNEKVSGMPI